MNLIPRQYLATVVACHRIETRLGHIDDLSIEQESETILSQYDDEQLLCEFHAVVQLRVARSPILWAYVRRELGRDLACRGT